MITDILTFFTNYIVVFLLILTVVVFVHELGHYAVARWNGVKVEVFSIGFGPEIFGWNDRHGTRWRISALPLGGYVKMFGDADAASTPDFRPMNEEEKTQSLQHKRVGQRMAIVAAGPLANFLFGLVALAVMFMVAGQVVTPPVVGSVLPGSAAEQAGLQAGDRVIAVNERSIERFQDLQHYIQLYLDQPLALSIERDGALQKIIAIPRITETTDVFGEVRRMPVLGIGAPVGSTEIIRHAPLDALTSAARETVSILRSALVGLGQIVSGVRDSQELGGPIRIAKGAGQAAELGVQTVVFYTILLSLNLGLINLFPIPMLDGGHLVFYAIEAIRRKPLSIKAQEYGFRIGFFLVFALMIFATRNDLADLKVWDILKDWFAW